MTTPKLSLPELSTSQAGKEITHNDALLILDALAQGTVKDKDLAAPPGSPSDGDAYIVGASATGDWASQDGKIAVWRTSVAAWTFITPQEGWELWVDDETVSYRYTSSAWGVDTPASLSADNELLIWMGV